MHPFCSCMVLLSLLSYRWKFWRAIYFGGLTVLRAICQYFICQKLHSVMLSILRNHSLCTRPAVRRASLIVGMEFTFESCTLLLQRVLCTEGEELARLSSVNLNGVYTVAVKTDGTKTVQIKRNNNLLSF